MDTLSFPITFLELLGVEIDITSLNFGKFPQSPILHYQFSSWMEKTMTRKDTLPLEKQIRFTIVWAVRKFYPQFCLDYIGRMALILVYQ